LARRAAVAARPGEETSDVSEPAGDRPAPPEARRLDGGQLSAVVATRGWVRGALRQEKRLQLAWTHWWAVAQQHEKLMTESTFEPPEVTEAVDQLTDEIYYLLLTAHQVVKGRELVQIKEVSLPALKTSEAVVRLRDVYEHWDKWNGPALKPGSRAGGQLSVAGGTSPSSIRRPSPAHVAEPRITLMSSPKY
jgi:hypothetical protein